MKVSNILIRLLPLVIISLLFSACAQLIEFDTAQSSFSKGAEIENRQLFTSNLTNAEDNSLDISSSVQQEMTSLTPEFYYSRAYAAINKAIKKSAELKKDGLLGNAMALKALCEWKLKKYADARLSALEAHTTLSADQVPSPRDRAVMTALGGFIENDLAYVALNNLEQKVNTQLTSASLSGMEAAQIYDDIKAFYSQYIRTGDQTANIEKAVKIIESAKQEAPSTHPIQSYLIMSQLVCMKNWSDALSITSDLIKKIGLNDGESSAQKWWQAEVEKYVNAKDKYLKELSTKVPDGEGNTLYQEWKKILF